jgi:hypothetical protein
VIQNSLPEKVLNLSRGPAFTTENNSIPSKPDDPKYGASNESPNFLSRSQRFGQRVIEKTIAPFKSMPRFHRDWSGTSTINDRESKVPNLLYFRAGIKCMEPSFIIITARAFLRSPRENTMTPRVYCYSIMID